MNNLNIALRELDEEWLHSLAVNEDTPCFEVSKGFLRWEQRVIYGKKSASGKAFKVIAIAAALLVLFSIIALSTTKGREFVMQFFKESAVYSVQAERLEPVNTLTVDYLPEGFQLSNIVEGKTLIDYQYTRLDEWLDIQKRSIKTTVDFDYGNDEYERIEQNGIKYSMISTGEYCMVIWNYHDYYYQVSGTIDKENALNIAYGVK